MVMGHNVVGAGGSIKNEWYLHYCIIRGGNEEWLWKEEWAAPAILTSSYLSYFVYPFVGSCFRCLEGMYKKSMVGWDRL